MNRPKKKPKLTNYVDRGYYNHCVSDYVRDYIRDLREYILYLENGLDNASKFANYRIDCVGCPYRKTIIKFGVDLCHKCGEKRGEHNWRKFFLQEDYKCE